MSPRSPGLRRREVLAALGSASLGATAGCVDFLSRFAWSSPNELSLTIATLPANVDAGAIQMAHQLRDNLEAAGIQSRVEPQSEGQLLRTVLMEQNFDLFITRHPGIEDPDELRSALHTRFSEEAGWQNPFGFNAPAVDDLLERQRRQAGQQREVTLTELQERLFELQPFSVLAYPSELSVASSDLNLEQTPEGLLEANDYLRLAAANPELGRLRVGILDADVTRNRNPLAVDQHSGDETLDLLYEPLVKWVDGEQLPWLAEETSWHSDDGATAVEITLQHGLTWHDGERLDATDVAFTYRFLQDTAMGDAETAVPAPQWRHVSSMIESVSEHSSRTVSLTFGDTSREVALDALTVPVLPRHVWIERTDQVREYMTQALVWENQEPVGSGPYRFESAEPDQQLLLTRFDDHFLFSDERPARYQQFPTEPFEEIAFSVQPQSLVLVGAVQEDVVDIGGTTIRPDHADTASSQDNVELLVGDRGEFYMLGFNTRRHPLGNHRFRSAVARLIDRKYSAESIMAGHADPSHSPLERTSYVDESFTWSNADAAMSFPGEDGQADQEAARQMFRDAGFRYSDEGWLVTQQ